MSGDGDEVRRWATEIQQTSQGIRQQCLNKRPPM